MPFRPCWLVPVAWLVLSTPPVWPQQPDWDKPYRLGGEDLRSVTAWLRKNNPDPVPVRAIFVLRHYEDFNRGVIDTSGLVFFFSLIVLGLFLTQRSVDALRWRRA